MRAALWILTLFAVAVAIALFAGNHQGTITLFWPPYRVDLSLNLVLLLLVAMMVLLHLALRALSGLVDLPRQARFWRAQQKERAMHAALLDALSHLMAGRYLRARKAAESALAQELGVKQPGPSKLERQSDMQVSTLRRIVEALGGKLEIVAALPQGSVRIRQPAPTRDVRHKAAAPRGQSKKVARG